MIKRLLVLGALALASGAAVRFATAPAPAVAVPEGTAAIADGRAAAGDIASAKLPPPAMAASTGSGAGRWTEVWSSAAPGLVSVSVAPGGKSVAWVDGKGSVRRIDGEGGKVVWQSAPLAPVNRLAAAPNGAVLVYSYLNPLKPSLRLLHPRWGEKHAVDYSVQGAVWDAALSPDGTRAVAGTGARLLYLLPLVPKDPNGQAQTGTAKQWKSLGVAESVCVTTSAESPAEPLALLGTLQEPGVAVWSLDGTPRWRYDESEIDRVFDVHLSADSSTAVAVSWRGPRRVDARIDVWDAPTGRLLWRESLNALSPRALVSRSGDRIAVSYSRITNYRTGDVVERKLALFDRKGHRLFPDKGSTLFSPELVALSADGERLTVRDGASTLYVLDARGRFLSKLRLPVDRKTGLAPVIKEAVPSPDGAYLLLHRGDGKISLYRTSSSAS